MKTLRPNDFFLNEDAPAYIEQANGLLSVVLAYSGDCFIGAMLPVPAGYSGNAVKIRMHVRSHGLNKTSGYTVRLHAYPTSPSAEGPVSNGIDNSFTIAHESGNPAIIQGPDVLLVLPEGFLAGRVPVLQIVHNTATSTEGFEPRIVAVEYEFI